MKSSLLTKSTTGAVAGVVGLLALTASITVTSELTFAAKGGNGKGGGNDGGSANSNNYDVEVTDHVFDTTNPNGTVEPWPDGAPANLYAPSNGNNPQGDACIGDTPGGGTNYAFFLPDVQEDTTGTPPVPNECATVVMYGVADDNGDPVPGSLDTPNGYILYDDIHFSTQNDGSELTGVVLQGQEAVGKAAYAHESEDMLLDLPVSIPASPAPFVLHVHATDVPVYRLSRHLGGKRVEIVGYVSVGDLNYTPQ